MGSPIYALSNERIAGRIFDLPLRISKEISVGSNNLESCVPAFPITIATGAPKRSTNI